VTVHIACQRGREGVIGSLIAKSSMRMFEDTAAVSMAAMNASLKGFEAESVY
jgi:hypothetical protein